MQVPNNDQLGVNIYFNDCNLRLVISVLETTTEN